MQDQGLDNAGSIWNGDELSHTLNAQRQRAREFLAAQREKFEQIEVRLTDQIDRIAEQLATAHHQFDQESGLTRQASEEIQRRAAELDDRDSQLASLQRELDQRQNELKDITDQDRAAFNLRAQELDSLQENNQRQARELADREAALDRRESDFETASREITQVREQNAIAEQQIETDREALSQDQAALESLRHELDQLQVGATREAERQSAEREALEQEIAQRTRELDDRETTVAGLQHEIDQQRIEIQARVERCQLENQKLEKLREEMSRQQHELQTAKGELERRVAETASQRRRIARDLKAQRAEFSAEMDRRRAELERVAVTEDNRLQQQLIEMTSHRDRLDEERQELRTQCDELSADQGNLTSTLEENNQAADKAAAEIVRLEAERDDTQAEFESQITASRVALTEARQDLEELRGQLANSRGELNQRDQEIESLRAEFGDLVSRAEDATVTDSESYRSLAAECDRLTELLEQANGQLEGSTTGEWSAPDDELQRRYELAMEDLRATKSENEQLTQKLEKSGGPQADLTGDANAAGFDWEAQKRKMFAQLDGVDDADPGEIEEKFRAEEVIQITDQLVAQKDKRIVELEAQLTATEVPRQETEEESLAVGATAIAEMLDQDDLIRQERENLRIVQDEWRQKLRQAEIDISVERAKIARERNQLEEKLHSFESERAEHEATFTNGSDRSSDDSRPKRRWLEKLGLGPNGAHDP